MEVDLVVLAQALVPYESNKEIANVLGVELDDYGFVRAPDKLARPVDTSVPGIFSCGFVRAPDKLARPVDTSVPGIFSCGYCQSPQDIPDSVIQASAAAARVAETLTE
jgi:heterodisulfide reductase subunit A